MSKRPGYRFRVHYAGLGLPGVKLQRLNCLGIYETIDRVIPVGGGGPAERVLWAKRLLIDGERARQANLTYLKEN